MLGDDFDQALFQLEHVIDLPLDVAGRSLGPTGNLVDHDIGIGKGEPFTLGSCAQQHRPHACGHAKTVGGHVAGQKLHGVVNG